MPWHWRIIFCIWVYLHETVCKVHSWSRYDVEFWPPCHVWFGLSSDRSFLSFDIVIPYLSHDCITMVRCVIYIQNLCMTLTFGLNIKILFSRWICVWERSSLLFDIRTWAYNYETKCTGTFMTPVWPWPLNYEWVKEETNNLSNFVIPALSRESSGILLLPLSVRLSVRPSERKKRLSLELRLHSKDLINDTLGSHWVCLVDVQ